MPVKVVGFRCHRVLSAIHSKGIVPASRSSPSNRTTVRWYSISSFLMAPRTVSA
jgi:hypothetical protein